MEPRMWKSMLSVAWVGLGVLQAGMGYRSGQQFYLVLGVIYALLGAGYYWFEVHTLAEA